MRQEVLQTKVFVLVAEPQLTRLLLTVKRDKPHSTSKYARMLAGSSTVDSFFKRRKGYMTMQF